MNESEESSTHSLAATVSFVAALSVVLIVEILGNIMVLCVLYRQRTNVKQRVANTLLANLALIDLLVATVAVPFSITVIIKGKGVLTFSLCQFNGFVNSLVGSSSILTMAVIAVDRYRAIVSPRSHRLRSIQARLLLISVWIVAILTSLLPIMFWGEYQTTEKSTNCKSENGVYLLLQAVVCFVVPLAIMLFCYVKIFLKVKRHRQVMINSWKRNNCDIKTEFKTAKIVLIVLTVFVLAWTPYVIVYLASSTKGGKNIPPEVFQLCGFLAAAHSMCNPIIYFTMNRKFRRDAFRCIPIFRYCFPSIASREDKRNTNTISCERANNSIVLGRLSQFDTMKRITFPDNLEIVATNIDKDNEKQTT